MYLEDPVEVLLRKPPPATAAPFLKRVQFLFEGEDSVQNYAKQDAFDGRFVIFFLILLQLGKSWRSGRSGRCGRSGRPGKCRRPRRSERFRKSSRSARSGGQGSPGGQ